jgi:hypothetical protein
MRQKVCSSCGLILESKSLQLRSDDEAPTLVLSCPIHGIHHDMCSKYKNMIDAQAILDLKSNPGRYVEPSLSCDDKTNKKFKEQISTTWVISMINTNHKIPDIYIEEDVKLHISSWSSICLISGLKITNGRLWSKHPIMSDLVKCDWVEDYSTTHEISPICKVSVTNLVSSLKH